MNAADLSRAATEPDTRLAAFRDRVPAPTVFRLQHVLVGQPTQHHEAVDARKRSGEGIVMDSSTRVITADNPKDEGADHCDANPAHA